MSDIQTKMWEKDINKLIKKGKADKLESYKLVIAGTSGIDDSIKEQYIKICDDAINEINSMSQAADVEIASEETSLSVIDNPIDASDVTVGEDTKHFKQNKHSLKKALATGGVIAVVALAVPGISSIVSCVGSSNASKNSEGETSKQEQMLDEIKDTLNFDAENTEVMITNIDNFITESMTKGLELNADNLAGDIESFVDFYLALNIDEIGPGYLAKLYQSDNKSYLDVFNNFVRFSMTITDEAMMSSEKEGTTFDITPLVANKEEAELLQKAFNLLAIQHDNGLAGDTVALESTTAEFRSLLEDTLLKETSASYSTPFKVMLAYSAMNFDTLLMNYENIVLVDDDVRKILYEDAEISCSMTLRDALNRGETLSNDDLLLLLNASEKNQSAVEFALQLEKKFDQVVILYNTAGFDYSKEISIDEVIEKLVSEVDFSFYKANQEYTEYNDITYEINHPTIKVPDDSIIVNDDDNDYFIEKEELDKYDVDTTDKTKEEVKEEYESKVEQKVEEELKDDKTFIDTDGNVLEQGEDAVDYAAEYSKGYTAGSKQGAIDGNALATKNATTTGSEGYVAGYAKGYEDSYEQAKKARLEAEKQTSTDVEKVEPIVEDTEVIEEGTKKANNEVITMPVEPENPAEVTTVEPSTPIETTVEEEGIIEEEVIEEGILSSDSSLEEATANYNAEVTGMSYEELYNIYYQYLYGSDSNSIEQTIEKTK